MKKWSLRLLVCVVVLITSVVLTACSNEADELRAQIETLESDNAELQSTISSLNSDNERLRSVLEQTVREQEQLRIQLEAAEEAARQLEDDNQGPLAITYAGVPNEDMSWPFNYGDLPLGLRVNLNNFDEGVEINWRSANEDVFTVIPGEDGTTATATPVAVGSAQVIVTVGDQVTRSWIRIT